MEEIQELIQQLQKKGKSKKNNDLKELKQQEKNKFKENALSNSHTTSNALTRAHYRFTLNQKRIMSILISRIDPRKSSSIDSVYVSANDLIQTFGMDKSNAHKAIKNDINALYEKDIRNIDGNTERHARLIINWELSNSKAYVTFHPMLIPHLVDMKGKQFSTYPLKIAGDFSSSYTWRLYELITSWHNKRQDHGYIQTTVDDLRKILGVPDSFNYSRFNQIVLKKSSKELLEKANLKIHIQTQKTGRRITDITITFNLLADFQGHALRDIS